jgi:hypothetical protein
MNAFILEELKVDLVNEKLRRHKSNWLRHVTSMNNNRMQKIMLNYRSNVRRRIGRPLKGLSGEAETGLPDHDDDERFYSNTSSSFSIRVYNTYSRIGRTNIACQNTVQLSSPLTYSYFLLIMPSFASS